MSLAATQLRLYIDSHRALFQDKRDVWGKLARRKARRDYHAEIGQRAFRRVVDSGARAYVTDLGITEKWSSAFSTDDRNETAKIYEREFRERYSRGDLDVLVPAKMRPKRRNVTGNPVRSGHDRATIRYNIETQRAEGKPMAQAVAIALRSARESFHAEHPGKALPPLLREVPKPKKKTTTKRAKTKTTTKRAKKKTTKKRAKKKTTKKRGASKFEGPSLTTVLKRRGYTHRAAGGLTHQYAQDIIAKDGSVVFTGTAGEVWAWVHAQDRAKKRKKKTTKKRTTKKRTTKKKATKKRAKKKTAKKRTKKKTTKKRAAGKKTTKKRAKKRTTNYYTFYQKYGSRRVVEGHARQWQGPPHGLEVDEFIAGAELRGVQAYVLGAGGELFITDNWKGAKPKAKKKR